jgi:hypothetical protein
VTSPTQRTLKYLRDAGFTAGVVEKWIPQTRRRADFLGVFDIVAIHPEHAAALAVQCTSGSNHASRLRKVLESPEARLWLATGNRAWVVSFTKKGKAGARKLWEPRLTVVSLAMFSEAA